MSSLRSVENVPINLISSRKLTVSSMVPWKNENIISSSSSMALGSTSFGWDLRCYRINSFRMFYSSSLVVETATSSCSASNSPYGFERLMITRASMGTTSLAYSCVFTFFLS